MYSIIMVGCNMKVIRLACVHVCMCVCRFNYNSRYLVFQDEPWVLVALSLKYNNDGMQSK